MLLCEAYDDTYTVEYILNFTFISRTCPHQIKEGPVPKKNQEGLFWMAIQIHIKLEH